MNNTARDVYEFIVNFKQENDGCQPTLDQIVAGVKVKRTSVNYALNKILPDYGLIEIRRLGKTRLIIVKGAAWIPPQAGKCASPHTVPD